MTMTRSNRAALLCCLMAATLTCGREPEDEQASAPPARAPVVAAGPKLALFFHGLIAFVPVARGDDSKGLHAYLLKAEGHACEHAPRLAFSRLPNTRCDWKGCKTEDDDCVCDLSGRDITLNPELVHLPEAKIPDPPGELPDSSNKSSLGWLLQMEKVHPDGAEFGIAAGNWIKSRVTSHLQFGWSEGYNCLFDEWMDKVYAFEFANRWNPIDRSPHVQAVSEYVQFNTTLSKAGPLKLTLVNRTGSLDPIHIELPCSDSCPDLIIANGLVEPIKPCETDWGHDFAFYHPLAWDTSVNKRLPHRISDKWRDAAVVQKNGCLLPPPPVVNVNSRPICPMVAFNAPIGS
jgi:hypothetical protein